MKKICCFAILALSLFISGCGAGKAADASGQGAPAERAESYESHLGDWRLLAEEDGKLYLLTALDSFLGATGISIDETKGSYVKGKVYSISGAPSHRQAAVSFEGEVSGGTLTVPYEDENWSYSGEITLSFGKDNITADIVRGKSSAAPLWGIPEGRLEFTRPINTEETEMTKERREELEILLSAVTRDKILPFEEGKLSDQRIIDFVGINLAAGNLDTDKYGDRVKFKTEVRFEESVLNDIAETYFGTAVAEPRSTDLVKYDGGIYEVPLVGGVWAHPAVRILLKDTGNQGVYYAVADYIFEAPMQEPELEYQYLFKLENAGGFVIKSITEIQSPVDFEILEAE